MYTEQLVEWVVVWEIFTKELLINPTEPKLTAQEIGVRVPQILTSAKTNPKFVQ